MDITEIVRDLIAKNKLDKAISELEAWATDNDQRDLLQRLSIHRLKLTQVKRNVNIGALSFSDELRENAILANAILELLDEVSALTQANTKPPTNMPEPNPRAIDTITILFLASNPINTTELQLAKEFAKIAHALQDNFQVKSEWAVTPSALQNAILRYKPQIIHFSGHGTQDENSFQQDSRALALRKDLPSSGIVLQNDTGEGIVVSGQLLQDLFKIFIKRFKIEAVILNACYSEEQAVKIAQHVPYVIGTNESIPDSLAIKFAKAFYEKMAIENDVENAFDLAKNVLSMNGDESDILVLYKDGTLYES